jgi:hypothetical protein
VADVRPEDTLRWNDEVLTARHRGVQAADPQSISDNAKKRPSARASSSQQ